MNAPRPPHKFVVAAVLIGSAVSALLTGCTATPSDSPSTSTPTAAALSGTDAAACTHFVAQPTVPGAPLLVVVVDRTGSVRDLDLSPDLAPVLAEIQSSGAVLQTIGVSGNGFAPVAGKPIALDPAPGKTSRSANQQRQAALGCVHDWLHTPDTLPVGDNTDLLAALSAAARQTPAQIVVISDGVNTTTELNLFAEPTEPSLLAEQIRSSGIWTAATGVPVHWYNLGETAPPLPEANRSTVSQFWVSLLGPDLQVHTRTGGTHTKTGN